jgi:hypothetical protein
MTFAAGADLLFHQEADPANWPTQEEEREPEKDPSGLTNAAGRISPLAAVAKGTTPPLLFALANDDDGAGRPLGLIVIFIFVVTPATAGSLFDGRR